MPDNAHNPICVALDTQDVDEAVRLAGLLKGHVWGVKLGKEFFTANGPAGVRRITDLGIRLFLDLKFHDIPNTVAGAVRAALSLKPDILNVHASGGLEMMKAAKVAAIEADARDSWIIGVTVLTSLDDGDLKQLGVNDSALDQVVRLALLAREAGLDGVVCSPKEIEAIRKACGADFRLVVPGIRPQWAEAGDQKRVMTPKQAMQAGADVLVIGRPITGANDPAEAAWRIADELSGDEPS